MPLLRRRMLVAPTASIIMIISLASLVSAASLTLEDAIARALTFAPSISSATARSDINAAQVDEARSPLLPVVTANGEYQQTPGYDPVVTNNGVSLAQLELDYLAFDGGRRLAQLRGARYASEAAELGVKAERLQIILDTTVAYFDLGRTREAETELQKSAARLGQYVKVIEAMQRSGRAITSDVLMLRSSHDSAALALAASHEAAAHASIVLGSMLGDFDNTALQTTDVTAALTQPPAGDGSQNPAFRAAAREVEAAKLQVAAARAERSPTVKISLTAGWEGVYPQQAFGHYLGASYDGAMSIPVFDGGLIRSHVQQAQAAVHAAQARQREIEMQNSRDLAEARSRFAGAANQLAILRNSRQTADDAFALAWTRFLGGGNITLLEVTSTYQQAEAIRLATYDQEFAERQATAQVEAIVGLSQ
jgi:outer membrane protein